jgi:hypothetical protein
MKKVLLLVLGLLCTPAYADSTIDGLGAAAALAGTESVPIFQTANPAVKATTGAIGNAGALTGDVTKSAGSGVTTLAAGSASNLNSGTLPAGRMPALTGDCTSAAGAVATVCTDPHPGYVTGNWYFGQGPNLYGTSGAAVANRISCYYGYYPRVITIRNVGFGIVTAGTSNTQIALYRNSGGNPAALIDNTPSVVNTGATSVATGALAADQQVGPGTANGRDVWHCSNQNDSTITYRSVTGANTIAESQFQGSATVTNILGSGPSSVVGKLCSGAACAGGSSTFGTWPATLAGTTWTDQIGTAAMPIIAVQIVSSP